ncbi:MAG: glycosyltransferase family 2 protein [Candidatus Obscuribacterales bacterium]|nr:glycosyltransferase family 2 protein [Candidatus Obscuribacterales bacterium]
MQIPSISVIVPAYNEERRLASTLESIYAHLKKRGAPFEILVIDDGSLDHTDDIVEEFGKNRQEVRLISYHPNRGKGYAVKLGMLSGQYDLLLFDDADGSSPIDQLSLLEAAIAEGNDIAIGSRNLPQEGKTVKTEVSRKYIGNTFNLIVQSLLLPGIQDTQCGFKLFNRKAAKDIFSVTQLDGFAFDVELLYIARLRGYRVKEIAINWTNVAGSKVNVVIDATKMLVDVLNIAGGSLLGRYRKLTTKQAKQLGLNQEEK